MTEWQAKHICTFIAASAGVWMELKAGQQNPLVEAAASIDIFAAPGTSPEERELDAMRGEKVADDWHDDPRLQMAPAAPESGVEAANVAGSYEGFLKAFGGPPPLQAVPDLPPEDGVGGDARLWLSTGRLSTRP